MSEDEETKLPPKMNLPKAGLPKSSLPKAKTELPKPGQVAPKKEFEKPASTTMHIDLDSDSDTGEEKKSAAEVISEVKDSSTTMHINLDDGDTMDDLAKKAKAADKPKATAPKTMKLPKPGTKPAAAGAAPTKIAKSQPGTVKLKPAVAPPKKEDDKTNHLNLPEKPAGGGPKTIKLSPAPSGKAKAKPVKPQASVGSTMQIDLTSGGTSSEAPTLIKTPGGPGPAGAPKTIKIKPRADTANKKSETSRISLEAAKAESGKLTIDPKAPVGNLKGSPKTIKIKPKAPGTPTKIPASEAATIKKKSETSRISLEDALASDKEPASSGGAPNTIRLKRPSEASTIKVQRPKKYSSAEEQVEEEAAAGENQTRRKTIKLKRPEDGGSGGKKKLSLARPQGPSGDEEENAGLLLQDEPEVEEVVVDQPGWPFLVVSLFTIGLVGTIAYCIAVQEFPAQQLSWFQQFAHPTLKVPFN